MQMQFTAKQRDAVYAGSKTEHRIPADGKCRYRAGGAYRVKVDGDEPLIVVTVVGEPRRQKLGEMRAREAIREGERHLRAFTESWIERHGKHDPDAEVIVLTIAPGDLRDRPRFLAAGGPAPICKATDRRTGKVCNRAFAVGQARCKCGAKRPPETADDYGYTMNRISAVDEAEALSDEDLRVYAWKAANDADVLRDMPARETVGALIEGVQTLREAMAEMKGRNRARARLIEQHLKAIEREAEKAASELPSEAAV